MSDLTALRTLATRGLALISASAGSPAGGAGLAWRITQSGTQAEVYLYGAIDGWELDGNHLAQQIRQLDATDITLRVNSPGGLVFDGIAVYAALAEHPATVTAHVDGLAASAASFIVQAAAHRTATKPGRMMIHDAAGLAIGDAATMREMAQILDDVSDSIAGIYADRAGETAAVWRQRMRDTTWYSAQQAADAGLVDEVTQPVAAGADADSSNNHSGALATARAQVIRARHRVRTTARRS